MPITPQAVRLAITAVTTAPPAERRARLNELMTAGVGLRDLVIDEEMWLNDEYVALLDEEIWLRPAIRFWRSHRDHPKREARRRLLMRRLHDRNQRSREWCERERHFREAHTVLGAALTVIGEDGDVSELTETAEQEEMAL